MKDLILNLLNLIYISSSDVLSHLIPSDEGGANTCPLYMGKTEAQR